MMASIPRVLLTFLKHKVPALLMGGQACILYGGAEFSRDIDFAIMVSPESVRNLNAALSDLDAERIFVPALSEENLLKGHACHFRCHNQDVKNLRIDVMGVMRGVPSFPELWKRREKIELPGVGVVAVMALADLVRAKKTQRDKDWHMIRQLIEADMYKVSDKPSLEKISFWLAECRTPELLVSLAAKYPDLASSAAESAQGRAKVAPGHTESAQERVGRPLLNSAVAGNTEDVRRLMRDEEEKEKEIDRLYWRPLKEELEKLRYSKK
ncbi:MAG: hypothetical protein Q7J59_05765 [Elusimicrobiota bacterium]|nr:hypothetical protein [Elusimicrobiota bacterium]